MPEWLSLAMTFSSRADTDPTRQAELRANLPANGTIDLLRLLAEGRLPSDTWLPQAACRGKTELFFPRPADEDDGRIQQGKDVARIEFGRPKRLAEAKDICFTCPVKAECLAWALRIGGSDKHAVLGATTPNERKQIGTLMRINLQGGHQLVEQFGWKTYRRVVRAVRKGLLDEAEPLTDDDEAFDEDGVRSDSDS